MDPLNDRLKKIEERLSTIEKKLQIANVGIQQPRATSPIPPKSPYEKTKNPILSWFSANWLVSVGLLLVIISLSWFVGYAFSNNLIGETARIVLSLFVGLFAYCIGLFTLKNHLKIAKIFLILGEAISILSLFAGYQLYHILTPEYIFAAMILIGAGSTVLALYHNLEDVGFASVLLLFIIPSLVQIERPNYSSLMSYVLIVDIAAICMFLRRNWVWTFHLAWLATVIYSVTLSVIDSKIIVSFFISAFYLLFFVPATLSALQIIKKRLLFDGVLLLISTTFVLIGWVNIFVLFKYEFIFYIPAAVLSFIAGYYLSKNYNSLNLSTEKKYTLGIFFGFNVIAFNFLSVDSIYNTLLGIRSGTTDTITFFIESAIAVAVAKYILKVPKAALGLSFSLLIPLSLLSDKYPDVLYASFNSQDFLTLCIAFVSVLVTAWMLYKQKPLQDQSDGNKNIVIIWFAVAGFLALNLIWNICHNIIPNTNIASGTALVIYTIIAEFLLFIGNIRQSKMLRYAGITVVICVLLQLFLNEIWQMPIVIRTITFVVVGIFLIATAFFDNKFRTTK
jgi:uncharacterized membrane protein